MDSGYWHVPIHTAHQDYLGVHYMDSENCPVYFVWTVLCVGLRDAAHIFTRMIAPLMSQLRRQGYRGLIYIGISAVQCSAVQCSAVQCSPVQSSVV